MTLTIDLATEEELRLRQRAAHLGQPTETVAAALLKQVLHTDLPLPNEAEPLAGVTDAEFDAYWGPYIGVIHGGHEPLSENCGEKFTDYLVEKKRQGHL